MGWTFTRDFTKQQVIDETLNGYDNGTVKSTTIAHVCKGNTLWYVMEVTNREMNFTNRFIGCTLLGYDRRLPGWGSKDMEESMGPNEVSCPLKYLDMVPDPGGYATEWRVKIRAFHAEQAAKRAKGKEIKLTLKAGCVVRLKKGCSPEVMKIVSMVPLVAIGPHGQRYKLPRRYIDEVIEAAPDPAAPGLFEA